MPFASRLVVLSALLLGGCGEEAATSLEARLQANCMQRGHPSDVCTCATKAMSAFLPAKSAVELEADGVARALDDHIGRCLITMGAYEGDVARACIAFSPLRQKVDETCACTAKSVARDTRVRDVLDREAGAPFPLFAQEAYFACAYESGALVDFLAGSCGGTREGPLCTCLIETFTKDLSPRALAGMSNETLLANAIDRNERCLVDAPHVRKGILKACNDTEKKKGVCDCAVKRFLATVPPARVLTILEDGWSTESMSDLQTARRACGGGKSKRR